MKTSELKNFNLDCAVAKALGITVWWDDTHQSYRFLDQWLNEATFNPSSNWSLGGPIIERESIPNTGDLQAAMRLYVARKLGNTVDITEN